MNKKDLKDTLKQPDTFISTSHVALKWIEEHARVVAGIVGLGAVLGLSYTGFAFFQARKEAAAAEHLYKFEAQLKKAEGQIRDERAKKMQELAGLGKGKAPGKADDMRPVDFAKDFAPIVASLKAELKGQAGTRAAMVSALNLSYFLVQQEQFQEALEVMNTPGTVPSTGDLLGGFWRMHSGLVLLENGKTDEALAQYDQVLAAAELKPFHPEAMLKKGIALEIKGDTAKAKDVYEQIGRDFPASDASSAAAQYLRLMELKAKG